MAFTYSNIQLEPDNQIPGVASCGYLPPSSAWHVYLPAIFLHVTMYALTLYRLAHSTTRISSGVFIKRFIEEGGPMYFMATIALIFTESSVSITDNMKVRLPGLESYLAFAMITIAVCHALLGIRSLAAKYHVDPRWLLSHNELSRVQYKTGPGGELLVEIDDNCDRVDDDDLALAQVESDERTVQDGDISPHKKCECDDC
ncbi:hypothetical protein SERLA73DRAFT_178607 [Serpula lacrymans var. lacrymans S7.3]|uniref:Uncharacterized protein n=2 Tax=Serpula lacrymans var. lacrymans TaxID=341189 RepID=F8PS98_SERL3|nr:hypothetical protein SERLA73DRAFT_178607 [Serpula lacrymans var. lacrymans S7.3]